ncbi:TPA: anti-phage protein KwaA [Salmonella enterica subsp. enterica serovar Typhimurium]
MKKRTGLKYALYILSLWLLFVSLFIMSYDKNLFVSISTYLDSKDTGTLLSSITPKNIVFISSFAMIVAGVLIFLYLLLSFNSGWSVACTVSDVRNESHKHLEFLTTYVMPLVFTDVNSKRTMLNLLIMIVAIGMIYVKTNRFYSNPSLALLGFRIFKANINDRGTKEFVIICHGEIDNNSRIKYIKLDNNTCLAKITQ